MAKKRRAGANKARREARRAKERPRASGLGPPEKPSEPSREARSPKPEAPSFWFGFEVAWSKLVLARVVFFGMLAVDALLQIRHAPRYGAGGFNVGQLRIFDSLGPGRAAYAIAELVNAYLFAIVACGLGTRIALPIAAAIYSWLYFGSQLDSYQHHYLVALLLWLACAVPWERPHEAKPNTPVRSWALRLMLVQIAIMYLWAAISKMSPAWWNGATLGEQITGWTRQTIDATIGIPWASRFVIPVELALASTIWLRPAWRFAAPLGIVFHVGILLSGLEIGLFAWLMLALYIFIVPDVIWIGCGRFAVWLVPDVRPVFAGGARWLAWGLAFVLGFVFAAMCRLPYALGIAIALSVVLCARTFVAVVRGRPHVAWLAAAHVLALFTWFAVDRAAGVASDYYLFWGGSARRLGDADSAMIAYEHLVEVSPELSTGHYYLGRFLLDRGREDDGLAELHEAQRLEPQYARAFVAEAQWLAAHGRRDDAFVKARHALRVEPNDEAAKKLLQSLAKP